MSSCKVISNIVTLTESPAHKDPDQDATAASIFPLMEKPFAFPFYFIYWWPNQFSAGYKEEKLHNTSETLFAIVH